MTFRFVSMLGFVGAGLLGLALLVSPDGVGSAWGIDGWTPGTVVLGRMHGVALMLVASALFAVRDTRDRGLQRHLASAFSTLSAVCGLLCLFAVVDGVAGPSMWSAVAACLFYALAWSATSRVAREGWGRLDRH